MAKKVAVIGFGYVGKAVANFLKEKFDVLAYDPFVSPDIAELKSGRITLSNNKDEVNACDFAVISVPTPQGENGVADLSMIEGTIEWLSTPLIMIKSTVPPGTAKRLREKTGKRIVFSPEYIGEGNFQVPFWKGYPDPLDMKKHDFMIIGGERKDTSEALEYFKRIYGAEVRFVQTDSTTAELCKYMENAFLATKVTFCNEFFEIAKSFGVDYDELREMWLLDGRIGRSHTAVFKESRGFAGKCLPKDVNGIVKASESAGHSPELLKAVLKTNETFVKNNPAK